LEELSTNKKRGALSSDFREDGKAAGVNAIRYNRDPNKK
jgi:hypothetical protein